MKSLAFPTLTGRSASTRVTEADRVNASVDRHYRKCQRRGVIPMWVKQRRGSVVLNAVQRSNTVYHRLAVKAGLKAAMFRREAQSNPRADRRTLLALAKHELKLARYWRTREQQ